ncbi:MAG: folylpolyglutamate synthase/dihydrofolate synthase family protein [Pyrinomonadaceae bacterium]
MSFEEAESYLYSLGNEVETMKLGLENITALLAALGDPQNTYKKVQVAGTNGKGSVCAFLDSICVHAGIRTGLYTSPHLVSIRERIKIDGADISEDDFAQHASKVREISEQLVSEGTLDTVPTFFEQVTAIALLAFADAGVEVAILETGLGGRFDATTAANAEIAAITRIDLDHQEYLGDTIEKIAAEKAAIITRETQDVVLGAQSREVMRLLRKHCSDLGIEPINDEYEPWRILANPEGTVTVVLSLLSFPPIPLGLKGYHQAENAQTAIQITKALLYHGHFSFSDGEGEVHIIEGLQKAKHPGRLERLGRFLLDGAHNPGGAAALAAYLDEFVHQPLTMIFGAMGDKDIGSMAEILWPKADRVILTRAENSRALTAEELARAAPSPFDRSRIVLTDSATAAIEEAKGSPANHLIVVAGSLYLVGEVRGLLE